MRVGIGSLPKQVFTHTHNFSAHFCQCLILCIVKTKKSSTPLKEPGIFLQFGESLPLHLKLVAIGVGPIFFFHLLCALLVHFCDHLMSDQCPSLIHVKFLTLKIGMVNIDL